jgi:hypothetical protein
MTHSGTRVSRGSGSICSSMTGIEILHEYSPGTGCGCTRGASLPCLHRRRTAPASDREVIYLLLAAFDCLWSREGNPSVHMGEKRKQNMCQVVRLVGAHDVYPPSDLD